MVYSIRITITVFLVIFSGVFALLKQGLFCLFVYICSFLRKRENKKRNRLINRRTNGPTDKQTSRQCDYSHTIFFTFVSILTLGEIAIGITSLPDSSTEFTISDGRILLEAHVSGNNVKSCKLSTDSKQIEKLLKSLPKTEQIGKKKMHSIIPLFPNHFVLCFFFSIFHFFKNRRNLLQKLAKNDSLQ